MFEATKRLKKRHPERKDKKTGKYKFGMGEMYGEMRAMRREKEEAGKK